MARRPVGDRGDRPPRRAVVAGRRRGDPAPGLAVRRGPRRLDRRGPEQPRPRRVAVVRPRRRLAALLLLATVPLLVGGAVVEPIRDDPVALPRRRRTGSSSGRSSPPASPSSTPASSPASAGSSAAAVRRGSSSPRPAPSPWRSSPPGTTSGGSSTGSSTACATIRWRPCSASSTTSAPTRVTICCRARRQPAARAAPRRRGDRPARAPAAGSAPPSTGPPTTPTGGLELRHRGDVVGRLVVGWEDGPSLRERDQEMLDQLTGPLSLAVGWVRLAADLRRSSLAIVSAREEERRRLRRDLHDGLGPALTGVSLGLRTAIAPARPVARTSTPWRRRGRCSTASPTRSTRSSSSSSASSATCGRRHSTSSASSAPSPSSPARSATIWRSTSPCRPTRSSCRPRSRWRPTASSPRPSPTSCATPARRAAG